MTRDPSQDAPAELREVCNGRAELIVRSKACPAKCGGHPLCRPCYKLNRKRRWLA